MGCTKLILRFDTPKNSFEIPYDHQYLTYAGLLDCIMANTPDVSASLHQTHAAPRYVMSQILGSGRKSFSKTGFSSDRYILLLNSRESRLLEEIGEAVKSARFLKIGKVDLPFYSYSLIPLSVPGAPSEFVSKSPIVIQERDRYFRSGDEEFATQLKDSILRKAAAIEQMSDASRIRFLRLTGSKEKLLTVAGGKIPCSMVRFIIDASPDIIETIMANGIGSKNQIGFGYVEASH